MTERASMQVTSSGGGPRRIARLVDGEPVWMEITPEEMAEYTPPPSNKYHVKITGLGEMWDEPKKAEWIKRDPVTDEIIGPTTTTFTRLEFEIQEGKGKGKRFSSRIPCTVYKNSHLGKVWMATMGAIPATTELTDLLGKELMIYVEQNEGIDANGNKKKYANPTWDTAKPVSEPADSDDEWPAA